RRHQARAPPWSSSTGSRGLHAPVSVVAFTGMRNLLDGTGFRRLFGGACVAVAAWAWVAGAGWRFL
ncbi:MULTISPECIES: hypothetical protein, partial [unclassified Bradyrhizobium]|uniref:hypothetical protein n=1 Tax=unclassified Bradyrhizobium TaxID=2631580 RepID=UPI001FFBD114